VNYEEVVGRIAALSGEAVDLEIWGNAGGSPVAFFSGELRPMPDLDSSELPPELATAVRETAEVFFVGESTISLWPSRFVNAEPMREGRDWLEVETKDAVIRIGRKRRRWVD
jgi:hypothetical protein